MRYTIDGGDTFPILKINLQAGEGLKAEWNAMLAMATTIHVKGKMEGGFLGALWRSFSGESFFLQNYTATGNANDAGSDDKNWLWLAPRTPGSITPLDIDGDLIIQKGGFMAGSTGVTVSTTMQNLARGFLSGEGFFVVKASGQGTVFLSSFGAIRPLVLADGEEAFVDSGHLVAWDSRMKYDIAMPARGIWAGLTSGELIGCRFRGPGTVYIQSLSPYKFAMATAPFLAPLLTTKSG